MVFFMLLLLLVSLEQLVRCDRSWTKYVASRKPAILLETKETSCCSQAADLSFLIQAVKKCFRANFILSVMAVMVLDN